MSTTNLDNGEVDVSARGLRTSLWCRLSGGGTIDITRAPGVAPLVGRDREQRALADVLAVGARRPAGVLLRGEAGIGKSSLWRSGLAMAREQRRGTLVARPAAEEKDIALSGLVDLLDGHALASAGHPVLHGPDTPLGRGRALLEEIRRRAADGPLVVAVDDTPWLDDASAQAMRYALRRLETEPVTVLATVRSSDGDVDRLELSTTLSAHPVKVIEVSPLGVDDLRDVLATHVDRLSRPMLRRIHAISAGNPFYAIELARCVQVGRGGQRVIVLPTSVREALDHRLAALDPDLRAVVAVLAVAGPQPREVLGEILGSDVGQVVDRGCPTGVLLVDEHARVRFAHPLLAAAADVRMGAADRRALHSRVALVIPDPEDGLRHRTLGTPDPDDAIAATAEATAQQARRRGAGDTAIALSEQAVRLTPPADVDAHTRRRLQLVDHLAAAGEVGRARAQVDDLVADLPRGHWGAEALVRRFYVDRDDYPTGAAGLAQALPQIDDHAIRARVLDMLGWVRGMFCGDLEAGLACAREAAGLFESGTDVAAGLLAAAHLAHMETAAGLGPAGAMAGVVARTEAHGAPLLGACPRAWLAKQLLWDGDVERVEPVGPAVAVRGSPDR